MISSINATVNEADRLDIHYYKKNTFINCRGVGAMEIVAMDMKVSNLSTNVKVSNT